MKALLRSIALAAVLVSLIHPSCMAQSGAPAPTFRIDSSLTLVDVIAEKAKTGLHSREMLTNLRRDDFRIFDNGHEMPILSFDIGTQNTTRPVVLWLIVQCGEYQADGSRMPPGYHSMFMSGKAQLLRPALAHLGEDDAVGVAHWCDNGDAEIDLAPGNDTSAALAKMETILEQKPVLGTNRRGELAMQRMIRMILRNTHQTSPSRLPVFLFLYGDQCATYVNEANSILRDLLETSGVVYGLNDGSWPYAPQSNFPQIAEDVDPQGKQIYYLVHFYSRETGGDVYSASNPSLFSVALDYILAQLHFRYTIGFRPEKLDGKRHPLKVELTDAAKERFPSAQLRYRPEYIPVAR